MVLGHDFAMKMSAVSVYVLHEIVADQCKDCQLEV